jgi:hypothetical protein
MRILFHQVEERVACFCFKIVVFEVNRLQVFKSFEALGQLHAGLVTKLVR